jgi:carbon-monoxide dehydrogenase small subunit
MLMSSIELVRRNPNPTEADVRHWLEGNLCRCTGYQNIVTAVLRGAAAMHAQQGV